MAKALSYCLIVFLSVSAALAQDDTSGIPEGGRWIVGGTFALSNIGNNELRGRTSYSGAEKEVNRVATFLPGMTIIYDLERSRVRGRSDYLEGTTHHGIPVMVLENELSRGAFGERDTTDVVTHQTYTGCRDLGCTSEVEVGIGFSFQIEEADDEKLVLFNPQSELRIVHTRENFDQLEARGYTTQVKGRVHPRLVIHDGYAYEISTGCGLVRSRLPDIEVSRVEYEAQPTEWSVNSPNWSLRAIEVFGLGEVVLNDAGTHYIGTLSGDIGVGTESVGGPVSLDFTVFAYRDSNWPDPGFFKFGGLAQTVTCRRENPSFGQVLPRYVDKAYLHFDMTEGPLPQDFPLAGFELPDQFEGQKELQDRLRAYLPRAFYYSVNNARQYQELFEEIVQETSIAFPAAVANVIARLNASCSGQRRRDCAAIVDTVGSVTGN
ncbi:MAG: hypothetical protein AAFN63_00105 [Pseudomonadota bacterium]